MSESGTDSIPASLAYRIWLTEKFSEDPPSDAEVKIRNIDTGTGEDRR